MENGNLGERLLQTTADGSHTLYLPAMDEHYHSINGAIGESEHIFVNAGLRSLTRREIRILEIGFGTGLNAFLTLREVMANLDWRVVYFAVELYPLPFELATRLNYAGLAWPEGESLFLDLHRAEWGKPTQITDRFVLHKIEGDANHVSLPDGIDLVYMDAFAPEKQPEMWNAALYRRLVDAMAPEATLVTYCAKGDVRRGLRDAGLSMERLPGPPGKRHILRGKKL